jgi:hypothetical protein
VSFSDHLRPFPAGIEGDRFSDRGCARNGCRSPWEQELPMTGTERRWSRVPGLWSKPPTAPSNTGLSAFAHLGLGGPALEDLTVSGCRLIISCDMDFLLKELW